MRVSPERIDEMYPDVGVEFASMLDNSQRQDESVIKEGRIVRIGEDSVMVDVSEKIEGRMSLDEIKDADGNITKKVGDTISVLVSRRGGIRVSHKGAIRFQKVSDEIKLLGDDFKDVVVEGKIIDRNKGGFVVESDSGVEYFMPRKHSSMSLRDKDESSIIGKRIKACILEVRKEANSIVISRKRFLDSNHSLQRENAKKLLESGLAYDGIVRGVHNFGIFVEIGNVEGLVPTSEISHKGPISPLKTYKIGDKVQVKPLEFDEKRGKLSLSIRALFDDPWKEIQDQIKVGYVIRVTVSNVESYGAFVDLGNDVEGFLHVSEMSWDKNIKQPNDLLKVGDEIDVEVTEVDTQNRKLRVSLKRLQDKPFEKFIKNHKVGDVVKGTVATITSFGAFINIGGIDGLLHNEDAFWDKGKKCSDELKEGDEIEVLIDKIDKDSEKVSLNRKFLIESPSEAFGKQHNIDDEIRGKVIDIKEFGVFVKVDGAPIDALIRNEDLGYINKDELKEGDEIEGALLQIDKKANRVRISVRRLQKKRERDELNQFNATGGRITLGDALGGKI